MKIAFFWNGLDGRYKYHWRDGLYAALKIIELEHEVRYYDTKRVEEVHDFKPDVVLFWEAPCSLRGKDATDYLAVLNLPYKKALLFAGGPVSADICHGFDLYFVESQLNEVEFEALRLPWKRAFGVNTQIMRPMSLPKQYDGFMQATFAGWKRHELFADALGKGGCVAGRKQETDMNGYNHCVDRGVEILPEVDAETIARLINRSHAVVNTAEYWGGGQRCTLEAMSCGVPVIVMSDSPKNCEFVYESGGGIIVDPNPEDIRGAIRAVKESGSAMGQAGREYVQSRWTEKHYADALLEGIKQIV